MLKSDFKLNKSQYVSPSIKEINVVVSQRILKDSDQDMIPTQGGSWD